jgi:hypothetical protein
MLYDEFKPKVAISATINAPTLFCLLLAACCSLLKYLDKVLNKK